MAKTGKRSGRLAVSITAAILVMGTQLVPLGGGPAHADPVKGSWSAPFNLGITAVHSIVLPSGKVLMVSRSHHLWSARPTVGSDHEHVDRREPPRCNPRSLLRWTLAARRRTCSADWRQPQSRGEGRSEDIGRVRWKRFLEMGAVAVLVAGALVPHQRSDGRRKGSGVWRTRERGCVRQHDRLIQCRYDSGDAVAAQRHAPGGTVSTHAPHAGWAALLFRRDNRSVRKNCSVLQSDIE